MKKLRVGVIGWGFMGKAHTHALRDIPLYYPGADFEIELACVSARRPEVAREAMRLGGFESCTSDWRELIARADIDVVSICTPNDCHEEMAIAALNAGKHVYLDKPMAVTGEEALRIADAAERTGVQTRAVFNCRYMPAMLRAKQLIDEGRIGNILQFSARYLHSGSVDPTKPIGWKQQLQGGALLDMGSHALDLLCWLIGYPRRAICQTHVLYPERPTKGGGGERALSDDHVLALLELPNGALGSMEASKIATGTNDDLFLEICGERGALKWSLMEPSYLEYYDETASSAPIGGFKGFTRIETVSRYPAPGGSFLPPKSAIGWERGHTHCYFDFLDAIAHGRDADCSIVEGARLQCLMDKLLLSAKTGAWVEVE